MQRPTVTKDRAYYEMRYARSRANLLLVVILALVNCIFAFIGDGVTFMFAPILPMIFAGMSGVFLLHPELLLEASQNAGISIDALSASGSVMTVLGIFFLAVAVLIILVYFLAWLGAKKKGGWIVAALVLFAIDCVALLLSVSAVSDIIDIAFHAWVVYDLAYGVHAWKKLKTMPEEVVEGSYEEPAEETTAEETSPAEAIEAIEPTEPPVSPLAAAAAKAAEDAESPEEDEDEDEDDDEGDF